MLDNEKGLAWKSWLEATGHFLFPGVCQICEGERTTAREGYICGGCWEGRGGVRFIKEPFCQKCGLPFEGEITNTFECGNCKEVTFHFSRARSAVKVTPLVLEVIHRYKYGKALWFEPFLSDLLLRQASPAIGSERWDLLVPVPLHPVKQREREFNQAERLARILGAAWGIPVETGLVKRSEPTATQTQLSRQERAANVRRAFAPAGGKKLGGEKIVLLDDVFTTGATTSACAKVLRQCGASEVCVWTVARGV